MNKISTMIALAAKAHDGQYDLGGVPYIFHIMGVTEYAREMWGHEDEDILCIAAGHDLLEDTDVTEEFILEQFGARVLAGIKALTKTKGQEYQDYQASVLSNRDAMKVKLCDLRHNMREDRVRVDEKTYPRMEKYKKFKAIIEAML